MLKTDCVREAVEEYGDMLYRICLVMLKNTADAEDAVQDTFIRYMQKAPAFSSDWSITNSEFLMKFTILYISSREGESYVLRMQ